MRNMNVNWDQRTKEKNSHTTITHSPDLTSCPCDVCSQLGDCRWSLVLLFFYLCVYIWVNILTLETFPTNRGLSKGAVLHFEDWQMHIYQSPISYPVNVHCKHFISYYNCMSGLGMQVHLLTQLTLKVLVATIDAQWKGMGDVGSARYEPALLAPCPTIRVLSYSN